MGVKQILTCANDAMLFNYMMSFYCHATRLLLKIDYFPFASKNQRAATQVLACVLKPSEIGLQWHLQNRQG